MIRHEQTRKYKSSFLNTITEIEAFDEARKDDDDYKEKVTTKCKQTLHWLRVAIEADDDGNSIAQT